jgi:hypothetical protein
LPNLLSIVENKVSFANLLFFLVLYWLLVFHMLMIWIL